MAVALVSTSSIEMWSCESCSSLNALSAFPICEICQRDNDANVNVNNTTWSCHQCPCDNHVNQKECDACGSKRPAASHTTARPDSEGPTATPPVFQTLLYTEVSSLSVAQRQEKDELDAQCRLIDIIHYCHESGIHFVDDQFVPSTRSLGSESTIVSQWLRIREISSSNDHPNTTWTVMSNPRPNDIEQGYLGDCWFMAALTLVTERPRMLSHILLTPTVNEEGVYLVRLCHNGLWKIVLLDDCFPCTASKQLAYAKARRRQLFVPLIEKACAKVWGSYDNLYAGYMAEALQLLTGAPSDEIQLKRTHNDADDNNDLLWAKLVSACEANLLMGAATGDTKVPAEEYARVHLNNNHMFSVLASHALSSTERFILIRDPHAQSKYTDELASPEILERLQGVKEAEAANGSFWVSWSSFRKFFTTLTICAYRDNLFDVRYEGRFTRHAAQTVQAYYFHLERSTTVMLSLFHHRSNRRKFDAQHTQSFVLCDIVKNAQIGRHQTILCSGRKACTEWIGTLPSGAYVLIPFSTSYWHRERKDDDEIEYTLVIHSSIQLDVIITEELGKVLADCLIANVVQHHKIINKNNDRALYISQDLGSYLILIVGENTATNHMLNIDIDLSKSLNIRHSRNAFITLDSIPPQHRQLNLLFEYIHEKNQTCKVDYTYLCTHGVSERRPSQPVINRADDIHSPRPILYE